MPGYLPLSHSMARRVNASGDRGFRPRFTGFLTCAIPYSPSPLVTARRYGLRPAFESFLWASFFFLPPRAITGAARYSPRRQEVKENRDWMRHRGGVGPPGGERPEADPPFSLTGAL